MPDHNDKEFCEEISRLMPGFLRAITVDPQNILSRGNIPISHILVVDVLNENGSCTMGELARALNLTLSAATAVVDKMVERRFVKRERDKNDRRVVRVSLVAAGEDMEKRIHEFRKKVAEELFSTLLPGEKKYYLRIAKKVHANIMEKNAKTLY